MKRKRGRAEKEKGGGMKGKVLDEEREEKNGIKGGKQVKLRERLSEISSTSTSTRPSHLLSLTFSRHKVKKDGGKMRRKTEGKREGVGVAGVMLMMKTNPHESLC